MGPIRIYKLIRPKYRDPLGQENNKPTNRGRQNQRLPYPHHTRKTHTCVK